MKVQKWIPRALLAVAVVITMIATSGCGSNPLKSEIEGAPAPTAGNTLLPDTTYDYEVDLYTGVGENFVEDPVLTPEESAALYQLDWHCTNKVLPRLSGRMKLWAKSGGKYGVLEGILGTAGAVLGFGSPPIKVGQYLAYIGGVALGGGIANGDDLYEYGMAVAHGYCMTMQTWKADELEGKLRRVIILPTPRIQADTPTVAKPTRPQRLYEDPPADRLRSPPPHP